MTEKSSTLAEHPTKLPIAQPTNGSSISGSTVVGLGLILSSFGCRQTAYPNASRTQPETASAMPSAVAAKSVMNNLL